jgi:hypothetical protein
VFPNGAIEIAKSVCRRHALATVTVAVPDFVVSARLVARTVTVGGVGIAAGAVYRPLEVIVPLLAPSSTDQVTAVFVVPDTVAANCCV